MQKIERGKPAHCVELVTGERLTGNVLLSDEEISVRIYSFTDHFHVEGERPIYLQTETNEIVSLHSNVTTSAGTHSRNIEPKRTTYRQVVIANIAVVGHDPWTDEDGIRRVVFCVKHTNGLMHHDGKVKAIGRSRYGTLLAATKTISCSSERLCRRIRCVVPLGMRIRHDAQTV